MRASRFGNIPLRRSVRRASLAAGAFACLAAPRVLSAQTVSPPIAEYQERARSSFQLINSTIFPLSAVLEVHGFTVTEQGEVQEVPLDTAKVRVKLSAMSFRIPPRQTYTVFYEATADSVPAWFNIVSAMTGAKTDRQCDSARMLGDTDLLAALQQATSWSRAGDVVTLRGAKTLRFRQPTN